MARKRRYIKPEALHEVVSRTEGTLPLPPTELTNELLRGIYARSQRDDEIDLCNFVHMNNHTHEQIVPRSAQALCNFYKETKKRTTEAVKRLLGRKRLTLWEPRSNVEYIPRLPDAVTRVVYLFCNPASAGLVDSIEQYPALNTWDAFKNCEPSVESAVLIPARCYYQSAIPQLSETNSLTEVEDQITTSMLKELKKGYAHNLIIRPFAWLKPFGITDPAQIEAIRQEIIARVLAREEELRQTREHPVIGAERLKRQEYFRPHEPKERGRKTFVYCSDSSVRAEVIAKSESLDKECRRLYKLVLAGEEVTWPPGVFIPWVRPTGIPAIP